MNLGEKIAFLAKRNGMSQAELARAVGTYPSRMSDWVNGKGSPGVHMSLKLARVLGVSLDYFADDELDEPPSGGDVVWESRILEVVRELGYQKSWRRLIGADESQGRVVSVDGGPDADASSRRGSA